MEKERNSELKITKINEYFKSIKFLKPVIGMVLGGTLGFLYYSFIGCSSGSCAITSNQYISVLFGGAFGFSFVHSYQRKNLIIYYKF